MRVRGIKTSEDISSNFSSYTNRNNISPACKSNIKQREQEKSDLRFFKAQANPSTTRKGAKIAITVIFVERNGVFKASVLINLSTRLFYFFFAGGAFIISNRDDDGSSKVTI